jgi:acyl carrier protein
MNVDEASPSGVLREIGLILERVRGDYELPDAPEITMDTRFQDDLELESIDLVELAGHLDAHYGGRVNFAEFIADLELEEIIALTVGRLVDYVVGCLRQTPSLRSEAVAIADAER